MDDALGVAVWQAVYTLGVIIGRGVQLLEALLGGKCTRQWVTLGVTIRAEVCQTGNNYWERGVAHSDHCRERVN